MPIDQNNVQTDPELFIIFTPISVTIASQTVVDNTLNIKMYAYGVVNTTGSAATLTLTDGDGNKFLAGASFDANTSQYVDCGQHGFYLKNGLKVLSDTDNALILWIAARKM